MVVATELEFSVKHFITWFGKGCDSNQELKEQKIIAVLVTRFVKNESIFQNLWKNSIDGLKKSNRVRTF